MAIENNRLASMVVGTDRADGGDLCCPVRAIFCLRLLSQQSFVLPGSSAKFSTSCPLKQPYLDAIALS